MTKLIISGVNHSNHDLLNIVAGNYGYAGLVRVVNECEYSIELWEDTIPDKLDNIRMKAEYETLGFDVSLSSNGVENTSVAFHQPY